MSGQGMRLSDAETQGHGFGGEEIAVERVDRLAEWLEMTLGTRLTAFAAGLTTRAVVRIAPGGGEAGPGAGARVRKLFAAASPLAARGGGRSAHTPLTGPDEDLDGRTP